MKGLKLLYLIPKQWYNVIRLFFHQMSINRQNWKDNMRDVYFKNASVLQSKKKDPKRFELFMLGMKDREKELYNMIYVDCNDKEIEKMYNNTFEEGNSQS
ncbi:MAG: hypothetical protein GY928_14745 [Colwellia sp.]|nr:hypothetical protein [Colwellia sp.]